MGISTVISYPGAKWKAWSQIKPLIPLDIEDWREPFLGGASMSLLMAEDIEFKLKKMMVGDLAPEIWAFWVGCRDYADEVTRIARDIFSDACPTQLKLQDMSSGEAGYEQVYEKAIEEGRKFWKWAETVDCSQLTIPERAARTFLVNRISFSGMGDSGSISKDQFTNFRFDKLNRILAAQPLLQRMEINNCSFEQTMSDVDPDKTFVFLDPPYLTQEKSGLYGKNGDTHHGFPHKEFAEFTKAMKCRWLMTYDDSIKVRRLYKGCYLKPFHITYTMAGKTAEDALAGEELFIANYDIRDKASEDIFAKL